MASDPAVPLHGSGPDAAIASAPEPRRRRWFAVRAPAGEAIRTLRLLLLGSILAPLLVLLGGSYVAYKTTFDHARTDLIETVAIAEENIVKVLDTHALVAARVSDLLGGLSDEAIRAREKELHDSLRLQIADLPQVETAWAVDRTGHLLVGARNFPSGSLDLSDRDYFRALREPGPEIYISGLQSRFDNKPFFAVARRRVGSTGEFQGVVVVAVSPDFFRSFYAKLLPDNVDYAAGIFRADGATLARYPEIVWRGSGPAPPGVLIRAAAQQPQSGVRMEPSAFDGIVKMIAYKRLDRYPIYVTIGRTRASILGEWAGVILSHLYFGVPATVGLVLLCLVALRHTRRGGDRAATLTQRLLAFSRRQPLDPKPLEVNRLIAGMSDLLRRTLGEEIEPETVLAGGLWPVLVDANQLEHSLLNLAINARDAMASGGKLTIETANTLLDESYAARHEELAPGQYVMISVSDTGSGMSAEVREKAFEPFFTTK